jgi:hypothetical protein
LARINDTSDGSNRLLRCVAQTDFFTDYTLTGQQNAALFEKFRHRQANRRPDGRHGVVRNVLTIFISPITL